MDEWDELTATHGPAVWRTICRLLGTADGAEDPFQDTFLEYFELSRRRRVESPDALLAHIASRRAIDVIRRRVVQRVRSRPLVESIVSGSPGPADIAVSQETLNRLREAIAELDVNEAAVFCLTQLEQMEHGEIARLMGLSTNHIAVILHRARARLQRRVDKQR